MEASSVTLFGFCSFLHLYYSLNNLQFALIQPDLCFQQSLNKKIIVYVSIKPINPNRKVTYKWDMINKFCSRNLLMAENVFWGKWEISGVWPLHETLLFYLLFQIMAVTVVMLTMMVILDNMDTKYLHTNTIKQLLILNDFHLLSTSKFHTL